MSEKASVLVLPEAGARDPALEKQYREAAETGVCLFCSPGYPNEDTTVLWDDRWWYVALCNPPRKELGEGGIHVLLVPKQHMLFASDMSPEMWAQFYHHLQGLERRFKLESYAVAWRAGYLGPNGAGIGHLHIHVMQGDLDNPPDTSYKFKVFDPTRVGLLPGRGKPTETE